MFALALWAWVWRVGSGWFCPKLDPGGHVFLLNVLLHRWIIHGEHVAHNTACSGSSALYLLTTTWTLVFHILWQHPPRYQIHLWLLYFALVRDAEVLTYPGVRVGTWTIQHQFRLPPHSPSDSESKMWLILQIVYYWLLWVSLSTFLQSQILKENALFKGKERKFFWPFNFF